MESENDALFAPLFSTGDCFFRIRCPVEVLTREDEADPNNFELPKATWGVAIDGSAETSGTDSKACRREEDTRIKGSTMMSMDTAEDERETEKTTKIQFLHFVSAPHSRIVTCFDPPVYCSLLAFIIAFAFLFDFFDNGFLEHVYLTILFLCIVQALEKNLAKAFNTAPCTIADNNEGVYVCVSGGRKGHEAGRG
jgi:hypothetical protein